MTEKGEVVYSVVTDIMRRMGELVDEDNANAPSVVIRTKTGENVELVRLSGQYEKGNA